MSTDEWKRALSVVCMRYELALLSMVEGGRRRERSRGRFGGAFGNLEIRVSVLPDQMAVYRGSKGPYCKVSSFCSDNVQQFCSATTMMDAFKVPEVIPQDLLLIQDLVGDVGTSKAPAAALPVDEDSTDTSSSSDSEDSSSSSDSEASIEEVEADLIPEQDEEEDKTSDPKSMFVAVCFQFS